MRATDSQVPLDEDDVDAEGLPLLYDVPGPRALAAPPTARAVEPPAMPESAPAEAPFQGEPAFAEVPVPDSEVGSGDEEMPGTSNPKRGSLELAVDDGDAAPSKIQRLAYATCFTATDNTCYPAHIVRPGELSFSKLSPARRKLFVDADKAEWQSWIDRSAVDIAPRNKETAILANVPLERILRARVVRRDKNQGKLDLTGKPLELKAKSRLAIQGFFGPRHCHQVRCSDPEHARRAFDPTTHS